MALKINQSYDKKLVILASYLHDLFNAKNRSIHNDLAYEYVLKAEDKFLKQLSPEELKEVAYAVLQHRANFKGEFYSPLCEIISSADRGLPDLDKVVMRSMKFNKGNAQGVYEHIKKKYGSRGYAKYPEIYQKLFKKELVEFKRLADEITVQRVLEICEEDVNL